MKKLFRTAFSLAAALTAMLCLCINSFAASIYFEDNANLYTDEQEQELMQEQQELCDYTGWNIAVITTDTDFPTDGSKAIDYAESRYKEIYGSFDASGILYLIDTGYRHFAIGGDPDVNYFNDARVQDMIKRCNEKYYAYDDMGNVETYFECVREAYDKGYFTNDEGSALGVSIIAGIIGGLVAAAIGVGIVISRYKFHSKTSATNYVRQGGVNMYRKNDTYLRETVTRTKIESSSGSGSHGSSGGHSMGGGGSGGHR